MRTGCQRIIRYAQLLTAPLDGLLFRLSCYQIDAGRLLSNHSLIPLQLSCPSHLQSASPKSAAECGPAGVFSPSAPRTCQVVVDCRESQSWCASPRAVDVECCVEANGFHSGLCFFHHRHPSHHLHHVLSPLTTN